MAPESSRPDVAVFIDFENVYVSVRDKLDANPDFATAIERFATYLARDDEADFED